MAVEKTEFDTWLKENLWRDLLFRTVIWVSVALLAAYFSFNVDVLSANAYFKSQTNNALRLANIIGVIAIFLGLVALLFKDLEAAKPAFWGQTRLIGKLGGVFRRLAGDLTLWALGVLVSVLIAVTIYGVAAEGGSWEEWALFSVTYLIVIFMCLAVAFLNVYVRRVEPFLANDVNKPIVIGLIYVTVIVGIGCATYIRHQELKNVSTANKSEQPVAN